MDPEGWIRGHVEPTGPLAVEHERPWATVLRVPVADGVVWFKACGPVQAFEPRLESELSRRWPAIVGQVLAHDEERAWLLLADAGKPIGVYGNPPEPWLEVLPRYAELQRGEVAHAAGHLDHGVPDLRLDVLPGRYEQLMRRELPLESDEREALRAFAPRFAELCAELAARGLPETIQHDDLHMANVYDDRGRLRVLDWGDSSIAHPFFSLVVTFRFLGEQAVLRDAYLEPWGAGHEETLALALRVGAFAHAVAWQRQRDHLPETAHADFDVAFRVVLRQALLRTRE